MVLTSRKRMLMPLTSARSWPLLKRKKEKYLKIKNRFILKMGLYCLLWLWTGKAQNYQKPFKIYCSPVFFPSYNLFMIKSRIFQPEISSVILFFVWAIKRDSISATTELTLVPQLPRTVASHWLEWFSPYVFKERQGLYRLGVGSIWKS